MIPTMPSKQSAGVKVRGACPKGHVTQTTSEPGRVTWRGECSDPKCKERVICRRMPAERAPAAAPAGEPEQSSPNTARKVSWNAQTPKHKQGGGDAGQSGGTDAGGAGGNDDDEHDYRHAGEPTTGPGQQAAESTVPGAPAQPGPSNGQPPRGRGAGRLSEHIRSRRTARATRERPQYGTRFPFDP